MGIFDFFKKKTEPSSEENPKDNNASLIVYTNKITKSSNISFDLGNDRIWDNIPHDIKRVLYTSDADKYSSYSWGISITISFDFSGKVKVDKNLPDDPSTIYFKAPISEPADPSLIPRPPYYPSYAGLTPEQRFIYLKWLQDISTEIDVGYKFIFYYGLERHLLLGDFDNAYDMIIRLRKDTINGSFRWYSLRALVYSLLVKNRPDFFNKLKILYDDEIWYDEQLWVKVFTNDIINPTEIIKILKSRDVNKRYISNEPQLYIETLEGILFEKFQHPYLNPNDFINKNLSGISSGILFANYSFPQEIRTSQKIPTLDMGKFYACIIELHNQCHELTKSKLAGKRKKDNVVTVKTKSNEKAEKHGEITEIEHTLDPEEKIGSKSNKKYWIEKGDEKATEEITNHIFEKMKITSENGEKFWFNAIKQYRESPDKRLALALKNLPYPRAFSECFIALRAMINEKKKNNENIENDYKFLYKLGVINSMCIPYSERKEQPGFNVMVNIPGRLLLSLPTPYEIFGYEKIGFSKTDCKAFVQLWGEPKSHTTMNEIYHEIWYKYESKLRRL
jgi:hypothetical protein